MKKILNLSLLLLTLPGYLEWPKDHHAFLVQLEYDMFFGKAGTADTFQHPLVVLPLLGQLLLIFTLFQREPGRMVTLIAVGCTGAIMGMLLLVGSLTLNFRIILSVLPFLITAFYVIRLHWRKTPRQ